jgi:hypothetical protein
MAGKAERSCGVEWPVPYEADAVIVPSDEGSVGHEAESCTDAECDDGETVIFLSLAEPMLVFGEGNEVVIDQGSARTGAGGGPEPAG